MQVSIREQIRRYKRQDLRRRLNTDACPQPWLQSTTVRTGGWMIETWNQSPQSEKLQSKLTTNIKRLFLLISASSSQPWVQIMGWAFSWQSFFSRVKWLGWVCLQKTTLVSTLLLLFSNKSEKFFLRHFLLKSQGGRVGASFSDDQHWSSRIGPPCLLHK